MPGTNPTQIVRDVTTATAKGRRARILRIGIVVLIGILLYAVGRRSGLVGGLSIDLIRAKVVQAGVLGVLVYFALFALGLLLYVPGPVFVAVGILVYGQAVGFAVSWLGAVIAVSGSFAFVRMLGGNVLAEVEAPILGRMLARLDARPIHTLIILRTVLWMGAALNYTLALTGVRFRDYVIGSALGLLAPILGCTLLFDWLLALLRSTG